MCIFIGCWPWSIKGHTHRWRQIHVRSRQRTCFSFFMPQTFRKIFKKPIEFLLYKTNTVDYVRVYCNILQMTWQRVKNNSHATRLRLVSYFFVVHTLWRHLWTVNYYSTYVRKEKYNLFVNYTITWLLCAFSLVVDRNLLKETHTHGVKSTSYHVSGLVFLFSCPKSPSINHLNFYCMKQIDYIFPCVCTVIDHRRRHGV